MAADALSHNDRASFLSQVPGAHQSPTRIPNEFIRALILEQPDWASKSWTRLLSDISTRVLPSPRRELTESPRSDA